MIRCGLGPCRFLALAFLVLVGPAVPGTSDAGTPPRGGPLPAGPPPQPGSSLFVAFDPAGITLEQAVRLAIANNPDLKKADAAVKRQEGVAEEQSGLFDLTLRLKASFEYRVQELTESRKEEQRKKRSDLEDTVNTASAAASQTQRLMALVQEAALLPPGAEQVGLITQISAAVGTQLKVLDALILNTPEPGKTEIIKARQSFITETISGLQSGLNEYNALVSEAQTDLRNWGKPPDDEYVRNGKVDLQFSKYFRNGLYVAPYFNANLDSTSFVGKPISSDFGGKGVQDLWTFKSGLNISLPLWRGRGVTGFAVGERVALSEQAAGHMAFEHQIAATALNTIRAYWDLRAAEDSLGALKASVDVAARVTEVTGGLIRAEELPRTELARAQAGEARARARFADAERRLRDARVALVKAIGVTVSGSEESLPRTKDAFPQVPASPELQGPSVMSLAAGSIERRRDVGASRQLEDASRIAEEGARRNLGPRLDLTGGTWMTALGERTVSRVVDRWVGPSASAGLEFEKPFGNNERRGQEAQRAAERLQQAVATADLVRTVRLDIARLAAAVTETVERVRQADTAARLYQQTVDAEVERFRVGETTLIDTLQSEQQMTEALLTLAGARRDLAQLVAELRYQTGTLVSGFSVSAPNLITVPSVAGRQP